MPAGGVHLGETYADAARRELREEAGLQSVEVAGRVGESGKPHPETGAARVTTYVHLRTTAEVPDRWPHVVTGSGEDAALRFACRWEPIPVALANDQDEFLGRLVR